MEELVSISVTVGERQYPLKIRAQDEELVRQAEHLINEKFNEFQLRFTGQEKIDYLAMSALMNFVDLLKNKSADGEQGELLFQKISEAEKIIVDALKKN
ncbi:MAG TPA: cell division protein ZapA [Chitinophagales bacterium]|nr:cell division protein ZapA [Chitinophagales bacterium]